ncbi:acyl-CoA dehydrogenase family protein [Roseovarius aestuariivivens]|uniref:acyl-CoA dehydrogenase family protein n=1 Tax=Roseovarius aestuariivivens TaxID=1888910 RepID=UPI00107FF102|nr:acyl-CoA dehydrogenase family protein [Roseovarius aestuariivivens]
MSQVPPRAALLTHEVTNQPDPRGDVDLWASDPVVQDHATAAGADAEHLARFGATMGTALMADAGREANRHPPELRLFDQAGRRLDELRYHPAYYTLMRAGIGAGYAALPWEGARGGHATHAAMVYLMSQVEPGVCCPMTMTYAAVPALKASETLFDGWVPKLTSRAYDSAARPLARKTGATLGMAMTEKQGGSDVRANTTRATRDGDSYLLRGHKWFCSAPMSDGFLTLAQAPDGLSCFLVPRWLEDGRNAIEIQRLKDKLGNRANGSAEIEYLDARAYLLGEEGQGVQTILEMVHHTRLDTALAPAGLMRAALARAAHWARGRAAFGSKLIDQPLMRSVLADLVLDWEGTLALGMHVACAFDAKGEPEREYARLAVALAKYMGNKLCPTVVVEAMEVLGGMGYVEDSDLPLFYREAPLNGIWEGSGNVICLDVLRTLRRTPRAGERLSEELGAVAGQDRRYDDALSRHIRHFPKLPDEAQARWYVESLATLLTASVLIRTAPVAVAEAFVASRLTGERGRCSGAIGPVETGAILARLGAEG